MLLFADLILIAVVIPGYFYVESQILEPANFEVTDLILDYDLVQVGEPIQIPANVTNFGDDSGSHTVILTIDDVPTLTKTVQLSGGETTRVIFKITETTEGNHTINLGRLTESFRVTSVTPTKEGELRLTNLVTSRKNAEIGDPITVSVTATNIGNVVGDFSLELFVNNQKRETKNIQLNGGDTTSVQFEIVENAEGNYLV